MRIIKQLLSYFIAILFLSFIGISLNSCQDHESIEPVNEGETSISLTAMPSAYSSITTRGDGEVISDILIDPANYTRSDFDEDKESIIYSLKFGFYQNDKLVAQSYKDELSNCYLPSGDYKVYAVANIPGDFVFDATVSSLEKHSISVPEYSSMNTTGMPMAGILPSWNTEEDGVVKMDRLFDKVILDWSNDNNDYDATDMKVKSFYNINQNTTLYPFSDSYIAVNGSVASDVDAVSATDVPSYDSQYLLYIPENYRLPSTSTKEEPDNTKKHSKIHLGYSYVLNGKTVSFDGDLAPYFIDAKKDTCWYQVKRNKILRIKPLSGNSTISVEPWTDSIYVAQRRPFSIKVKNVGNPLLPISVEGTNGLVVDNADALTKSYDKSTKVMTISGQYSCHKYEEGTEGSLSVYVGDALQNSCVVTTLAPVLKFEEDGYTLSNSSRTADYTINYHRIASDRNGKILEESEFASDLYSELLDYGQPTVTETKIQNTVKVEGTYGNFYLSQDITSATAGTYQNAVSVSPKNLACGVVASNADMTLDMPNNNKPIKFSFGFLTDTAMDNGESDIYYGIQIVINGTSTLLDNTYFSEESFNFNDKYYFTFGDAITTSLTASSIDEVKSVVSNAGVYLETGVTGIGEDAGYFDKAKYQTVAGDIADFSLSNGMSVSSLTNYSATDGDNTIEFIKDMGSYYLYCPVVDFTICYKPIYLGLGFVYKNNDEWFDVSFDGFQGDEFSYYVNGVESTPPVSFSSNCDFDADWFFVDNSGNPTERLIGPVDIGLEACSFEDVVAKLKSNNVAFSFSWYPGYLYFVDHAKINMDNPISFKSASTYNPFLDSSPSTGYVTDSLVYMYYEGIDDVVRNFVNEKDDCFEVIPIAKVVDLTHSGSGTVEPYNIATCNIKMKYEWQIYYDSEGIPHQYNGEEGVNEEDLHDVYSAMATTIMECPVSEIPSGGITVTVVPHFDCVHYDESNPDYGIKNGFDGQAVTYTFTSTSDTFEFTHMVGDDCVIGSSCILQYITVTYSNTTEIYSNVYSKETFVTSF